MMRDFIDSRKKVRYGNAKDRLIQERDPKRRDAAQSLVARNLSFVQIFRQIGKLHLTQAGMFAVSAKTSIVG
jgi:hypothetical protein